MLPVAGFFLLTVIARSPKGDAAICLYGLLRCALNDGVLLSRDSNITFILKCLISIRINMANKKILNSVVLIYIICLVFRLFEYFVLKTDSSIIGEAVVHKIAGIIILIFAARYFNYNSLKIGFSNNLKIFKLFTGVIFGLICFAIAYVIEVSIAKASGSYLGLGLYVTSYSINGNLGNQTALIFFLICIIGNIINVVMEEGIFRGLFVRRLEEKYSFVIAALISSVLFGLWHGVAPLRSFLYGETSAFGLLMNCLILILSSALVGFKFCLLTKLTGSVYMSMGEHFVNNTIINILHVMSAGATDNYQVIRISIAQSISFIVVLIFFLISRKNENRETASFALAQNS